MNLFKWSLIAKGLPINGAIRKLKLIQNLKADALNEHNIQSAWAIFEYHRQYNHNYKAFLEGHKIEKWADIPIWSKKNMQIPLEERLTEGISLKKVYINNTSGSSGTPFFFAKDKAAHAMTWAVILDRFGRHKIQYGKSLQARFFGIPFTKKGYYKEKIKDFIASRVRFPVFDLSDPVLELYLNRFSQKSFIYLNGYTSSLVLFAKFLIQRSIILKEVCPSLKVCITTSEICNDLDRETLQRGFGIPVVNEYGAAELDLIAFEDEDLDWIISCENILVEIVDENGSLLPDGQIGRILVTSLHNKAMPFIRYELGDRGSILPQRKGIYPIIQNLEGRTNDIAVLPSGKKSPGLTFYYISKGLLEGGGFMKEFIIRQTAIDSFHYEYVADRALTPDEIQKVHQMMDKYLEPGLKVSFERKDTIERTKAGKLKHFQTDLPIQF
jgi:phenylacetate-CoA ligase